MRILFLNQSPREPDRDEEYVRIEALLNSYASPGTRVELAVPDDYAGARVFEELGSRMALNGLHHAMETPALVRKIVWAQEKGYDAVVQSNTFDPGVEAGRLAVRIPVIGLFRTSLHIAASLADRIGITVPLPNHVPYTWRIVRAYHMQDFVATIQPLGIYGKDLAGRKQEIFDRAAALMDTMVKKDGAECIIPLGGALFPYVVSPAELEQRIGAPVLNTKAIGIRFAEMCVALGLSHSPVAYPGVKMGYETFSSRAFS